MRARATRLIVTLCALVVSACGSDDDDSTDEWCEQFERTVFAPDATFESEQETLLVTAPEEIADLLPGFLAIDGSTSSTEDDATVEAFLDDHCPDLTDS